MKVYFDTNVLVAALKTDHVHHPDSYRAVNRVRLGEIEGYVSAHGLVEFYSVMTRAPFTTPIYPDGVLALVERSILPYFRVVEVTLQTHMAAIVLCATAGWKGGRIHDAVHIRAAEQAGCDQILTYNLPDFQALSPEMADRMQRPSNLS